MSKRKNIIAMLLSLSLVLGSSSNLISYAIEEMDSNNNDIIIEQQDEENKLINQADNNDEKVENTESIEEVEEAIENDKSKSKLVEVGNKYKKTKKVSVQPYSLKTSDKGLELGPEAIEDLKALEDIEYLEKMTDDKYEVALSYDNGEYTYLDSTKTIEEAKKIVNSKSNEKNLKNNIIPVVIDEDGLVVYAAGNTIAKIIKIKDGKPVNETIDIYKSATGSSRYTYINHSYIDDAPILENNGKRVKVQINGLIGWIDISDSKGKNVDIVSASNSLNLSYYRKTSNGDLQHYISSDVNKSNSGHFRSVGVAPSFMSEGKKYYSYDGIYFYTDINTLINDLTKGSNSSAVNKSNPFYNYYLYLPGRSKTSHYAKEIEDYIQKNTPSDSVLRGQGINLVKAQNKYGVNANFILGVAMNESAKGTSTLAKTKNNLFGIKAYDTNVGAATTFKTVGGCIETFAKEYMSNQYFNPKAWQYSGSNLGNKGIGANVWYASDPFWGEKAANYMYETDKHISGSKLIENNKLQLAIYDAVNAVKNSSGTTLYEVLKSRVSSKSGQIGDPLAILGQTSKGYEIYPDRQYAISSSPPVDGEYYWNMKGYVNTSGAKKINTKQDKPRVITDTIPTISASNKTINLGDKFNSKTGITASDKEDGNLTSSIVVKSNAVNTLKAGKYKVVYQVTDTDSNTSIKEIYITVNNAFANFSVNSLNNKLTTVTGTGTSGATVKAYVGSKQIGSSATVNSSGKYSITVPAQKSNTKITVKMSKSGYSTIEKSVTVVSVATSAKKALTKDIYKYDAGKNKYLTYINGKGYSQFTYLNTTGKYAFTPSSWMTAAGLSVTMPTSKNGYTMMIDNSYIKMYNEANSLLNKIKSGRIAPEQIDAELSRISNIVDEEIEIQDVEPKITKATPKKTLTKDIYKYDAGKGKYLTYINGKGYSQYTYLNTTGKYAFTPSSWMTAAGLTVTMPTSKNGYTMKITNPYISKYNDVIKQIQSYK
ncbi:MAG: glucosaminidase domain-containing protein [Peptostreptococcaceae bacterium]